MKDMQDDPVCMVPDTLLIRSGDMELGWWSSEGIVLPITLRYGWPQDSQWNQLLPCVVPEAGLLSSTDWPKRIGDTLWIEPGIPLEVSEQVHPNSTGYLCSLIIHNQTASYVEVRLMYPARTPRGAKFEPGEGFRSFLGLQPGDMQILEYRVVYD
jgi:hypothetical protein